MRCWNIVCSRQAALDWERKLAVVHIYFSVAFNCVSHSGLLFKLRDVGVGGAIFNVKTDFLGSRVHRVVVDVVRSEDIRVVSGVRQDNVVSPWLFLLYKIDLPKILENALVGYSDEFSLLSEISKPGNRVPAQSSLNHDLARIGD